MQKISDSTNSADGAGEFTEGNPAGGVPATLIKARWLNAVQRELLNLITGSGLTRDSVDDSQVYKAVLRIAKSAAEFSNIGGKPTTLSGYGITDAYTKSQADGLLAVKAAKATTLGGYGITDGMKIGDAGVNAKTAPLLTTYRAVVPSGFYLGYGPGSVNPQTPTPGAPPDARPTILGTVAVSPRADVTYYLAMENGGATRSIWLGQYNLANDSLIWTRALTSADLESLTAEVAKKAPLDSPFFTNNPRVPTVASDSNDYSAVNTFWARRLLSQFSAQYGVGHSNGGVIPATKEELNSLPSGNYYYPSTISPYPLLTFVQRMTYATNRGFEIANYPYQKRILGRVSNNDGTWQEPFELANLDSPAFTNVPTCPTAAKGTNTLQLANTAFVQAAIASLVDAAPGALDTLKELAAALGNDPNFSTTVLNALAQKLEQGDIGYGGYALDYPGNDLNTWVNKSAIYRLKTGALGIPPGLNPQGSIVQHEVWGIGVGQQTVREHATGREWHRSVDQNFSTEWFENTSNMAGAVVAFAMNAAPSGFLIANGAAVSRTSYPLLFSRIGTQFGAGNGSTTFNLPDLRAEVIRGLDAGRGVDAGRVFSTVQLDALQGHGHQNTAMRIGASGGDGELLSHNNGTSNEVLKGRVTAPVDLAGYGAVRIATETRMRNIALLYCIKY